MTTPTPTARAAARQQPTRREIQILRLAADGATDAQIGEELHLTTRTVSWHLGNLYARLNIVSPHARLKAVLAGINAGAIDPRNPRKGQA